MVILDNFGGFALQNALFGVVLYSDIELMTPVEIRNNSIPSDSFTKILDPLLGPSHRSRRS